MEIVNQMKDSLSFGIEVYDGLRADTRGIIDDPAKLVGFLGLYLKPKELEKKKNGEVFTPPSLINEKFDKLEEACPDIWKNPSRKFLDPANGIGNYPAIAYQRLMRGLEDEIPNVNKRKKHILENMLYMCEITPKNVEVSRKLFDPDDNYKLNIHQGSFLDLDTAKEWGIESFDVIMGNPPYQDSSGNKGRGHTLWVNFVSRGLNLIKRNGYLAFVHPAGWRQVGHELLNKMQSKDICYLSIHDEKDGMKTFRCNTRYDWYILKNCPTNNITKIKCQDGVTTDIDISTMPFIPNSDFELIKRLTNSTSKCSIIHSESAYECRKKWMSKKQNEEFKYLAVYSVNRQNQPKFRFSNRNDNGHFGIPKVIFGSGATGFIVDRIGEYGLTQWAKAIAEKPENLDTVKNVLNSSNFMRIIKACSVGKAEINVKILKFFNEGFWRELV